ncbi:coiled-coil domain-containing protein 80 [Microcaecilia unicolor]|uniref:Coiled-coil domain-containing protein 80 n=1 Tax=Microcaecilia unicolor TaxID=1415580 RepID=A0A6P7Y5R5_9AMPH|nr:coiled-coil domain-containing protein 80 [Microcaecilia unicolor]
MNSVTVFCLTQLLAMWAIAESEEPQGPGVRGIRRGGNLFPAGRAGRARRTELPQRGLTLPARKRNYLSPGRDLQSQRAQSPSGSHGSNAMGEKSGVEGSYHESPQAQPRMVKDEGASSQSRMLRFPSGSGSPNILASFAGKNRVWIISAPHASDGYYRLMMSLLKDDVYCELAERHIQQILLFHQEGEEGGKIRRITSEGKIVEQPLDPALIPKLMTSLKLEKGKFGMVLLKKTLQVEERYPYPVRLEALYETVDQSPMRRIEKLRQKGFVQKCKAAGVEGQVTEDGNTVKPTKSSTNALVPPRKPDQRRIGNQPTRDVRLKFPRKHTTTVAPPTTTTKSTTAATTVPTTTRTTTKINRIVTAATRPPPPPPPPTTVLPTTLRIWTTKVFNREDHHKKPVASEVTTKVTVTEDSHSPAKTDRRKDKKNGHSERHLAVPRKPSRTSNYDAHMQEPPTQGPISDHYTRASTSRHQDNRTDKKGYGHRDSNATPGQHKPFKPNPPKKKAPEKDLTNEYENVYDAERSSPPQIGPEEVDGARIPEKKGKEQKRPEKLDKAEKKKKKKHEKPGKGPKEEKQTKKDKAEKKPKAEKDRSKKNKKANKSEKDEFLKPVTKAFVHSPQKSLATFLAYFESKRRLLLITTPKDENNMYVQQRDEYLETVCEMAVRKISIITIFGSISNSTMKIDHFQLDNEKPMKVIGSEDLLDQDLINELRNEYGMTYNDFFMVLTDLDMKVKQYYEVPIAMKSVFDLVDTFQSRIKEMEKQKREGISCKKEDKTRSLENFLSRFRWRRRLVVISAPNDEEWAYQHQLYAFSGQACNLGLRHIAILKLLGIGVDGGGVLELYPINGSSSVDREDLPSYLVKDIRNYFQISPEYFSMLLVGKDGNVKSWYPSPMWSMAIVYDLIDSMQLRRQEMAIQQSLGMRCPEDEYGYHNYHHQGYQEGYYHGYHE